MNNQTDTLIDTWLTRIEKLHPNAIDLGLDRVTTVAKRLNVLSFDCPVVMVGGTNGKGSCVTFLEAILSEANYQVGTYTSPHLISFNERIRIANISVDNALLCELFAEVEAACGSTTLTYFEFTTLTALLAFRRANPDVILLEVGMGGRLDAVNIIDPDIAIITMVDLDHTQWLGNDREKIGFEKAGIMRKNKPVICGDINPPQSILKYAEDSKANLYSLGKHFQYTKSKTGQSWQWQTDGVILFDLPLTKLPLQNAATAVMATVLLRYWLDISVECIHRGLEKAHIPGRFHVIDTFKCILDVAHNPSAAIYLSKLLASYAYTGKVHAVVGMLADKDIYHTLQPLTEYIDHWYLGDLKVARGGTSELLHRNLRDLGVEKCYNHSSVTAAFLMALATKEVDDLILVFGSFYTVAEILHLLQKSGCDRNTHSNLVFV
jgi:dihydrofolate synthase / folylpolyglutamate synthase